MSISASPRTISLAQTVSVVGHPASSLLAAIIVRTILSETSGRMHWAIIAIPTVIVAGVLFYSFTKVRRGNWIHIDASVPTERKQLNIAMTLVLLVSSLVSYLLELPLVLSLGLFVVAMMVGTMLLLDRWLKVSLHMSFALFASSLFLPNFRFVLGGVLLSLAIGWSRIVLGRHTRVEVAAGSLIGATAGIIQFIWGIN